MISKRSCIHLHPSSYLRVLTAEENVSHPAFISLQFCSAHKLKECITEIHRSVGRKRKSSFCGTNAAVFLLPRLHPITCVCVCVSSSSPKRRRPSAEAATKSSLTTGWPSSASASSAASVRPCDSSADCSTPAGICLRPEHGPLKKVLPYFNGCDYYKTVLWKDQSSFFCMYTTREKHLPFPADSPRCLSSPC